MGEIWTKLASLQTRASGVITGKSSLEHGEAGKAELVVKSQITSCLANGQPSRNGGVHSLGLPYLATTPKSWLSLYFLHLLQQLPGFCYMLLKGRGSVR